VRRCRKISWASPPRACTSISVRGPRPLVRRVLADTHAHSPFLCLHVFPYPEKLSHLVTSYHHFSLLVLNIHIYIVYWNICCLLDTCFLTRRSSCTWLLPTITFRYLYLICIYILFILPTITFRYLYLIYIYMLFIGIYIVYWN
jgi:hypothetical protein